MKIKAFIFLFFLSINITSACLVTHQYKTFPVGISNDKIITVDINLERDSYSIKDENFSVNVKWHIKIHISEYNLNQQMLSSKLIENYVLQEKNYLPSLKQRYLSALSLIKASYNNIDYLNPDYLSFCDFQKDCELINTISITNEEGSFINYKNQSFKINILEDRNFYGFKPAHCEDLYLSYYLINSVRRYKSKKYTLVISHFQMGHEQSMNWFTDNPNEVKKDKDGYIMKILTKEYKLDFEFSNLENAIYEEPLMHHGFGFDVFIVETN